MNPSAKLEDLLKPGLDLVVCGTAASSISAERGQYYAGPGNRFWSVLEETGLTPRRLQPSELAAEVHSRLTQVIESFFSRHLMGELPLEDS